MSDNPFDGPANNQRTVYFRPNPGGRPAAPTPPDAAPRQADPVPPLSAQPVAPGDPIGPLATGQSPLLLAATPLLQLLGRIRNTFNPPDPAEPRLRAMQAIRDFETAGRVAGIPHDVLHQARYALCASLDDVVLHTQWGAASTWVQAALVSTFHQEVVSGEGFFRQLTALKQEPAHNLALLELMYFCLALGYQGQYRLSRQGPAQLEQLREDLYQTIVRLRGAYEYGLSPHWKGIEARYRPARATVPVWVMALVAIAVVAATWGILLERLNAMSDGSAALAERVPPAQTPGLIRPPPPVNQPPPAAVAPPVHQDSAILMTLKLFLEPETRSGQVTVDESPTKVAVRIFSGGMFASGSAAIRPDFYLLLKRIGMALNIEQGAVLVTGHTDNVPIRTIRFPSNLQLSVARAQAAKTVMARTLHDPDRVTVSGRADTEPLGDDKSEAGREKNRRIEITLQRQEAIR
jgi:type VI secretion system protein ImpK